MLKFLIKILNPSNRRVAKVINKNQAGFEIVAKEQGQYKFEFTTLV